MNDVLNSFGYCLDFVYDLVGQLTDEEMVSQPAGLLNHPAWVAGHLTFSCQALSREIGMKTWLPTNWGKRYGMGSIPVADIAAYESKLELTEILRNAQARISVDVQGLTEAQLAAPLPDEKYHSVLPTVGHCVTQILVAHTAYHIGQLVVWRRKMGLPPLEKPFL